MEPFSLVIFGITSNLAQLKLIPALYDLEAKKLLPADANIIGIGRRILSPKDFQNYIRQVLSDENHNHKHSIKAKIVDILIKKMRYINGDFESESSRDVLYQKLKRFHDKKGACCDNRLYYLATYPVFYASIFDSLQKFGLNKHDKGWVRVMIEKPIGHNLASAKKLDKLLHKYFAEEQVYRLDHYLGKETIQNILVFNFGNGLLTPLMNHNYVDHIQITAAESFGIGNRGGYYDKMGALRDVGQNHLLQMLVVATMDPPSQFSNNPVTYERIKILKRLKPLPNSVVFGQYQGYKHESNINPKSSTDTFFFRAWGVLMVKRGCSRMVLCL